MSFLAPLWLFALIPWAAFALWMLVGRRRRQWVPFLALWEAPEELRRPKKGFEPPPIALVLALLALLLGILGMSRPEARRPGQSIDRGRVTIIVDRGASMSALAGDAPRFAQIAQVVGPALAEKLGLGSVDLIDAADGHLQKSDRSDWYGRVKQWKRTAVDTTPALPPIVRQLVERGEPTIVISDHDLGFAHDQLVQIKPETIVNDAGIVSLSARPGQVMATLRATHPTTRTLSIRSGDKTVQQRIDLKPGVGQNVFLDLIAPAEIIEAALDGQDDFEADDRAWLVRRRTWPIIEPRAALPDEIRRMVEIYSRHRPPGDGSVRLAVARPGELKSDEPGVLLAPTDGQESARGDVHVVRDHPLLAGVDWTALARGATISPQPPGDGWTILANLGDKPILAVRDGETRQVWVGFESRAFARTPAFVLFWTNLFDWAGAGVEGFQSARLGQAPAGAKRIAPEKLSDNIDSAYWPGLFETTQGKLALNAPPVTFSAGHSDWAAQLSRLKLTGGAGIDLTPWLAMAALVCLLGAAATWEKRRLPAPRPPAPLDVESTPLQR